MKNIRQIIKNIVKYKLQRQLNTDVVFAAKISYTVFAVRKDGGAYVEIDTIFIIN